MEQTHDHENVCERYLLGELSEPEQAHFEESYFADDSLFERFLAVKDDLIDAYVRGELTGPKRERFEQHFLASKPRQRRLEEAKELIRAISAVSTKTVAGHMSSLNQTAPAISWWQSISRLFASRPLVWQGALAVVLLLALTASVLLVRQFQSRWAERERVQSEEATLRKQEEVGRRTQPPPGNDNQPSNESDKNRQPKIANNKQASGPVPKKVASIMLLPFNSREVGGAKSLTLRSNTTEVRLQLVFKAESYGRYDVVLRTVGGEQVAHRRGLKAATNGAGKSVSVTFDPSLLRHQDYIVTLSGLTAQKQLEAIDDYYFRVERSTPQSTTTPR